VVKTPVVYTKNLNNTITLIKTNIDTVVTNLIPTPTYTTNYEYLVNSPSDPTYPKFLKFCANFLIAQNTHRLTVETKPGGDTVVYNGEYTRLTDVVAAVQANLSAKYDADPRRISVTQSKKEKTIVENNDVVDEPESDPGLNNLSQKKYAWDYRNPSQKTNAAAIFTTEFKHFVFKMRTVEAAMYTVAREEPRFRSRLEITNDAVTKALLNPAVYTNWDEFVALASSNFLAGFVATNSPQKFKTLLTNDDSKGCDLLEHKLAIVVRDVSTFTNLFNIFVKDHLNQTNKIIYCGDAYGPLAIIPLGDEADRNYAPLVVRPLMKLTRQNQELPPYYKLAEIPYDDGHAKETYFVGDSKDSDQNRTVFTLLSYLYAQTTIGTQNLPVQQLIQVQ
jgi:hypothetical protein